MNHLFAQNSLNKFPSKGGTWDHELPNLPNKHKLLSIYQINTKHGMDLPNITSHGMEFTKLTQTKQKIHQAYPFQVVPKSHDYLLVPPSITFQV